MTGMDFILGILGFILFLIVLYFGLVVLYLVFSVAYALVTAPFLALADLWENRDVVNQPWGSVLFD